MYTLGLVVVILGSWLTLSFYSLLHSEKNGKSTALLFHSMFVDKVPRYKLHFIFFCNTNLMVAQANSCAFSSFFIFVIDLSSIVNGHVNSCCSVEQEQTLIQLLISDILYHSIKWYVEKSGHVTMFPCETVPSTTPQSKGNMNTDCNEC